MVDYFENKAAKWDNPEKIAMANRFVDELKKHVTLNPNWKGLEIGGGTGLVGLQLFPKLKEMVIEDTSEEMLKVLRAKTEGMDNIETLWGDVTDYKNPDIDFVFSNMAFHHIENIPNLLNHLFQICKTGAVVVIGDLRSEDGSFHRFDPIPHRGFDTDELSEQFRNAGFTVQLVQTYHVLKQEKVPGKLSEYEQFILIAHK